MKKLLFALVLASAFHAQAQSLIITNLLQTTNVAPGTNYTASYNPDGHVSLTAQTFLLSNGGLLATNDIVYTVQMSLDNTNFLDVYSYRHPLTNATVGSFKPVLTTNKIYLRVKLVTTNTTTTGVVGITQP